MAEIKLYKDKGVVLVSDEDYERLNKYRWTLATVGYAVRSDEDGGSIYMHREILKLKKGDKMIVDHINGDKLDNRRSNLRICTKTQNQLNQPAKKRKDGSSHSKYKGVSRRSSKSKNPWRSRIVYNGKEICLYHETEIEAALGYNILAIKHHKGFARINKFGTGEFKSLLIRGKLYQL